MENLGLLIYLAELCQTLKVIAIIFTIISAVASFFLFGSYLDTKAIILKKTLTIAIITFVLSVITIVLTPSQYAAFSMVAFKANVVAVEKANKTKFEKKALELLELRLDELSKTKCNKCN